MSFLVCIVFMAVLYDVLVSYRELTTSKVDKEFILMLDFHRCFIFELF